MIKAKVVVQLLRIIIIFQEQQISNQVETIEFAL